jgi:hypothetical protein
MESKLAMTFISVSAYVRDLFSGDELAILMHIGNNIGHRMCETRSHYISIIVHRRYSENKKNYFIVFINFEW